MSKKYELLLVLPGTLDEKEVGKQVQEIKDLVSASSQDVELNNLGKVRLAYPIKQIRYGYYYTLVFNAEPKEVKVISEKLRLRTDVLRAMISHFNTNVTAAKKIIYNTNEAGVTTMEEKEPEVIKTSSAKKEEKAGSESSSSAKVDLKAIDDKLNEILDSNIIPGV
jgi:small subunit ribosomal protein S6